MTPKSPDSEIHLETLTRLLRHLGWSRTLEKASHPLATGRIGAATPQWVTLAARSPETPTLFLLVPLNGTLTPLNRLYTQFEDMGSEVRHLLSWWREHPPRPDFLVLTDGRQTILFDPETEESLASSEEPSDLSETVLPHLTFRDVARGSLRDYPRRTVEDYGKELGAWTGHWVATVGASLGVERPNAQRLVEAILLARIAERLGFSTGKQRIEDWSWMGEGAGGGEKTSRAGTTTTASAAIKTLKRIWHSLEAAGYLRLLRLTDRQLLALVENLTPSDLPDRWLGSISRLSWKRFRSEVFAVAMADEELRHKSWTSMVTGETPPPPGNLKDTEDPSQWLHTVWELDLDRLGYSPVLQAFDTIVDGLREYNLSQRATLMRGDRAHLQLSLFDTAPDSLSTALRLSDPVGHALSHVLRVRTASPDRARMMRFVLAARAMEINEPAAPLLNPLPDLRQAVPEPQV